MIAEQKVDYKIRRYQPEDEGSVLALLSLCLSSSTSRWDTPNLWRWKHQQSPFGPSFTLVAEDAGGDIVGVRALMSWRFASPSGIVRAVRPVDTATHPAFRRYGIFAGLTKQALAEIQAEGTPLVFNTPNTMSLPGYMKMGWMPVGIVRPLIKVVNPIKALSKVAIARAKRSKGSSITDIDPGGGLASIAEILERPGIESLLQQSAALNAHQISTERSLDYLKWRYRDHISLSYHALWLESSGRLDGGMIVRPYQAGGLQGLVIEELLLAEPDRVIALRLIEEAVRGYSADVLTAYFGPSSPQRQLLLGMGFHQDIRKKVNVVMRSLNPLPGMDLQQVRTWGLSMGDLEFL